MVKVCKVCKEEKDDKEFDSRKLTCNTCRANLKRDKNKKEKEEKTKEIKLEISKIKEELKNNLKDLKEKDDEFLNFIKEHEKSTFLNSSWFWDIWVPLSRQEYILITEEILTWMGFSAGKNKKVASQSGSLTGEPLCAATLQNLEYSYHQKYDFIRFLNKNNLTYKEINYNNSLVKNYPKIQYDIKILELITPKNLETRTWIIMGLNIFKESLMMLNTEPAIQVRKYYIDLEQIFMDYLFYKNTLKELKLKEELELKTRQELKFKEELELKNQQELKFKEEELKLKEELKEANRKALTLKKKLIEVQKLKKEEFVYISCSTSYAKQNRFKVGGISNVNQVTSRLGQYNGRSADGDLWEFVVLEKTNNYKSFERKFWDVFDCFRDKNRKEIIIMHYDDLELSFFKILNNYDSEIDFFNQNLSKFKERAEGKDFRIPEPIKIIEFVEKYKIENGIIRSRRFESKFQCDYIITRGKNKGNKCKNTTSLRIDDKYFCYKHK